MTTYFHLEGCVDNNWCYIGTHVHELDTSWTVSRRIADRFADRIVQLMHPIGQYSNLTEAVSDRRKDLLDHGMVRHEGIIKSGGIRAVCSIVEKNLMQMFERPEEILGLYDELRVVAIVSK